MLKALLVTVLLTAQGDLLQEPRVIQLDSLAECVELLRQRSYLPPLPGSVMQFDFCEIGETA